MSERNYYVICDDNCRFPSMTKEQILAAIAEATGETVEDVDQAFITKLKEQNKGENVKLWIGTSAQYDALTPEDDVLYWITDDTTFSDIITRLNDHEARLDSLSGDDGTAVTTLCEGVTGDVVFRKVGKIVFVNIDVTIERAVGYSFSTVNDSQDILNGVAASIPEGYRPAENITQSGIASLDVGDYRPTMNTNHGKARLQISGQGSTATLSLVNFKADTQGVLKLHAVGSLIYPV